MSDVGQGQVHVVVSASPSIRAKPGYSAFAMFSVLVTLSCPICQGFAHTRSSSFVTTLTG